MYNISSRFKSWQKAAAVLAAVSFLSGWPAWSRPANIDFLRPLAMEERGNMLSTIPDRPISEWIGNNQEWTAEITVANGSAGKRYKVQIKGIEYAKELVISVEAGGKRAEIRATPNVDLMRHPELAGFIEECNERYENEYGENYELADKFLWLEWVENKGVIGAADFDPVDFLYTIVEEMARKDGRDYILREIWKLGGLIKATDRGAMPVDAADKEEFEKYKNIVRYARNNILNPNERRKYYSENLPGSFRMLLVQDLRQDIGGNLPDAVATPACADLTRDESAAGIAANI